MSRYDDCREMELLEKDGAVTKYLSLNEVMLTDYKYIKTYKYRFKRNDRIDRIALVLLGKSFLWPYIMLVNPQYMEPSEIQSGDIILIPKLATEG